MVIFLPAQLSALVPETATRLPVSLAASLTTWWQRVNMVSQRMQKILSLCILYIMLALALQSVPVVSVSKGDG